MSILTWQVLWLQVLGTSSYLTFPRGDFNISAPFCIIKWLSDTYYQCTGCILGVAKDDLVCRSHRCQVSSGYCCPWSGLSDPTAIVPSSELCHPWLLAVAKLFCAQPSATSLRRYLCAIAAATRANSRLSGVDLVDRGNSKDSIVGRFGTYLYAQYQSESTHAYLLRAVPHQRA